MKKLSLLLLAPVLFVLAGSLTAQNGHPNKKELIEMIDDPATFGKTVKFFGTLRGGSVLLNATCVFAPGEIQPTDRCIVLGAETALTTFDERDLGSVTLPAHTFETNIYLIPTHIQNYQFFNGTGAQVDDALFVYIPYLTLESTALNDPRAVDPVTHLPLNGKLDFDLSSRVFVDRSLAVNERSRQQSNYSRALITGINKPFFVDNGLLPADIVDKMFDGQLTIHMNLRGKTRHVNDASFLWAVRIMGN